MKYYVFRREDAAVDAAAAGYLTGKPGVALTVSAPGFDSNRKIDAPLQGDIKSILQKLVPANEKAGIKAPQDWLDLIAQESRCLR